MADTGKDAGFSFNGTAYTSADCLGPGTLNDSINEVIYQCSGLDKGAAGTRSITFSTSMALAKTDTTKWGALTPGATGVFEAHPAGDSSGNLEVEATDALITRANKTWGQNAIINIDLTIRLQDITLQAAT